MLIFREIEGGRQWIGFACDICGKPIELVGDPKNWGEVYWHNGPVKVAHIQCAHFPSSQSLVDAIIHWAEQLPEGLKLVHQHEGFMETRIWPGFEKATRPPE